MYNFVYAAIGKMCYLYETIYSIYSLQKVLNHNNFRIVIYTDNERFFQEYYEENEKIDICPLSSGLTSLWLKSNVFGVKIYVLQEFLKQYRSNALFIDTDTFIYKDISDVFQSIQKDTFIMYRECTPLAAATSILQELKNKLLNTNETTLHFYQYLLKEKQLHCGKYCFTYPENFIPFNSGVIGIHYDNLDCLEQVSVLNDFIYNQFGLINAEEFAFATVFQQYGNIVTGDLQNKVYHYTKFYEHTRLFGAYILGCITPEDAKILGTVMCEYNIDISRYDVEIKEIEKFTLYMYAISQSNQTKYRQKGIMDEREKEIQRSYYPTDRLANYGLFFRKYIKMELM